jgi:regulation of enolase protein 1 (concanavalin A-like superfamily)
MDWHGLWMPSSSASGGWPELQLDPLIDNQPLLSFSTSMELYYEPHEKISNIFHAPQEKSWAFLAPFEKDNSPFRGQQHINTFARVFFHRGMALLKGPLAALLSCALLFSLVLWSPTPATGMGSGPDAREWARSAGRSVYDDDFNGTSLDPKWSWCNSPASFDVGNVTPGHLRMVARRGTNFSGTTDSGAIIYQNISGDCSIETRLSASPQTNYEKAGIMIRQDGSNWVALKYQAEDGAQVELSSKVGGSIVDRQLNATTANPVWLRLVRVSSSFTTYYSTNGVSWILQWTGSVIQNDTLMVGLLIADGGANTDFTADFDYFHYKLPNQPPSLKLAFSPVALNEDSRLALNVFDHFSDPEGETLTFTVTAPHIKGSINTITNDLEIYGLPNWNGVENAYVRATDPYGLYFETPLNVTVTSVEDPPFLSKDIPDVIVPQNGTNSTLDLAKCFMDNDSLYGDSLTYSVSGNGSIRLTISPSGKVTMSAPIDFVGTQNMTFTATDRTGLSVSGPCKVIVQHVNQAPQVIRTDIPSLSVNEDDIVTMDLAPVFWDPDGDPITLVPSGNVQIDVSQANGSLVLTFRPKADASGFSESIKLTAKDNSGLGTNFVVVTVTVVAINDPPRITGAIPAQDVTVNESQTVDFGITASDPESGPVVNYTWYLDGAQVTQGASSYTFRTDYTSAGDHKVMVSVGDGELFTTRSWNVTVLNMNREPSDVNVNSPTPGQVFTEGTPVSFEGSAIDADGDPLVFIWMESTKELGRGRSLSLLLPAGPHGVVLQVSDGTATVKSHLLSFQVKANAPPQLYSLDPSNGWKFEKGAKIHFVANAGDADNDTLTYNWTENGNPLSREASFYRSDLPVGTHNIHLVISDGKTATETNLAIEIAAPAAEGPNVMLFAIIGAVAAVAVVAVIAVILMRRRRPPPAAAPVQEPEDWWKVETAEGRK